MRPCETKMRDGIWFPSLLLQIVCVLNRVAPDARIAAEYIPLGTHVCAA